MRTSPRRSARSPLHARFRRLFAAALALACLCGAAPRAGASDSGGRASIAAETDILSFFISGYSGIVNVSFANGLQFAAGTGRYDLPSFLLEGDEHYDEAKWEATSTSVQVARLTYRFHGPMKNGPALGIVGLHQNMRLSSAPLDGDTKFRVLNVGVTGGWYQHFGRHFYVYPTVASTNNSVLSGDPSVGGTPYKVERWAPNASLHIGWEWELSR